MSRNVGLLIVVVGFAVVVIGVLVSVGALDWFGRLPGDVRAERGSTRVFVPIVSSIVASIVLTVVINVVLRILR